MSGQAKINHYISTNNWKTLEQFLKGQSGFIDKTYGGRYICGTQVDDYSDITKICWSIFHASMGKLGSSLHEPPRPHNAFAKLPGEDREAILRVINELKRLYNETETALGNVSCCSSIATRVYDFLEQIRHDGYATPVARLEDVVVSDVKSSLKSS